MRLTFPSSHFSCCCVISGDFCGNFCGSFGRSRQKVQEPRHFRCVLLVTRRRSLTMSLDRTLMILIFILQTGAICSMEKVTKIVGRKGASVHLPVLVPPEFRTRDVFWRHLSPTDHLVASFSRGSFDTVYHSCFYGRVQILKNFTLVILNVTLKDNGIFTCQMVDTNGHMRLHQFHLTVYELVVKPEVQVYTSGGNAVCSVFLACNTSTGSNVSYSWTTDTGQGGPLNRTYVLHNDSHHLKALLTPNDKKVSFTCSVTNLVSQENTTIVPWSHCFDKLGKDTCFSSGKIFLVIGIFLAVAFTVMMFLVFLLSRNSGKNNVKNRREKTDKETARDNDETAGAEERERAQDNMEALLQRETTV
ncbi:SLAM family member 8-like [Engystomops pustulosus]|uniref:SLAM family member 8-like n=1 Tax=Engystomops pustulosus TaxID=76066 RepID=UPI003AFA9095